MALAGEDLEEIGAENIDNAELAEDVAEAEIGLRLDRGEHSPTSGSRTSAMSTCGSTPSTRHERSHNRERGQR